MPLSEQEQRLLDEMERQLMQNDADVVHAGEHRSYSYRNMVLGALLVFLGLVGVLVGIMLWSGPTVAGVIVGVAGFVTMLGGVILAVTPAKEQPGEEPVARASRGPGPGVSNESFLDRMNDRWDRRQQER
ncbi:DUF3040 domain-containing protein [Microbacterium amylolyticum]|uniref:DUF3040 domain-containing protein n=1 Tax=Microbacterium amylolyticum TaxID=936337 RepID=A0ABS4ZFE0_9MICO|nr:DUF3040 domain-containing protein [Microbacterium amylolyticum]MBP2436002.1 hypothetical protein [Microbacterium amylolyticum]